MIAGMAFSRYSSLCSMGGALLAAALAWPPAAYAVPSGASRAGAARAGTDPAPQERVLDVTLVSPPGTAARPEAAPQSGPPPALASGAAGAAGRRGGPG